MRHRVAGRKLNRTSAHRMATLRNLAQSLIEHGQIRTTLPKAKALRPFVERLITIAKKARDGDLESRRRVAQILADRAVIPADHQEAYEEMSDAARAKVLRARSGRRHRTGEARTGTRFTAESVVRRLIETVAADYDGRPGGYTRIVKLADTRIGDGSPLAVVQLVGQEEDPGSVTRPSPTARRRRTEARYAMAEKGSPRKRRAQTTARAERREQAAADVEEPEGEEAEQQEPAEAEDAQAEESPDEQAQDAQPEDEAEDTKDKPAE
jgi:large subunit ribosomal protein L17